ncbi:hypothetical protein [Streptomyces sp. ME19-01-6]|uniref:hypothetical protein n=1 Tax=Streptomyces sp. ME19-01-6 TaxID=3028686 RepID=UPI0029B81512|nr:hypothetical protein [Streptomyces sp. ME19-01-6]MDX3224370.1 hypothetical protein [Streptomyces sp. ME19-01-6]
MYGLKRWLDRSLTAQAALIVALGVGISAVVRRGEHPASWVVHGVLYAAIGIAVVAAQRRRGRRAAGTDVRGLAELNRKIRHCEVPSDPEEQEAMRRLVADHLRRMERAGRWLPYWLGFMGLVAVGILAVGVATGSWLFPLVYAVFVAGFCYWALWMRRRSFDRCHFMRSALERQGEPVW